MQTQKIFINLFYTLLAVIFFYIIDTINAYMINDSRYGDYVFYLDSIFSLNSKTAQSLAGISVNIAFLYLLISFLIIYFNKEIYSLFSKLREYFKVSDFVLIFFISILYKCLVYQFNFSITMSMSHLDEIFINGYFNDYKLYNYLVYGLSLITDNYKSIIFILQIILASLSISIFYLMSIHVTRSKAISVLISLFLVIYMPLIAIQMHLWVDIFYMFFFILSFYFLFEVSLTEYKKNIKYLLLTMLICTLLREQTIYMLPLYLFFIIVNSHSKKLQLFILVSLAVIIPSFIISWSNMYHYGISSNMKSKIFVVKAIQYGYLNENIRSLYESKLDTESIVLLNALEDKYETKILPHKRITFKDYAKEEFGKDSFGSHSEPEDVKEVVKNKINTIALPLMRPDYETIREKSIPITPTNTTDYYDNIQLIKERLVNEFQSNQGADILNIKRTSSSFQTVQDMFESSHDKNIIKFFLGIVNQYCGSTQHEITCIITTLKSNVNKQFIMTRSDNYYYSIIGIEMADNYDKNSREFYNHPYIDKIEQIILAHPQLYIVQSILIATSMVGILTVDNISIGESLRLYDNNIIPSFLIGKHLQTLFVLPVNLWYLFSLLAIIGTLLFVPNSKNKNICLLMAFIPLYYGFFLAFATFSEFLRLFTIMSPFLFLNYFVVLSFVLKMIPNYAKKMND